MTEQQYAHPSVAQVKERWYRRAGRRVGDGLKYVGSGLKKAVKPTLIVLALGASCYGGFEAGRGYEQMMNGTFFEEQMMYDRHEQSIIKQGSKLYLHDSREKNIVVDPSMMQKAPGYDTIDDHF